MQTREFCFWQIFKNENKQSKQFSQQIARDGHLIYCYGDCERKYDEEMASLRENRTGDMMKNIWMDVYNKQLKKNPTKQNDRKKR